MSDFYKHTGLSVCGCFQCRLIRCGAVDADWEGWRDVEFAGAARVILYRLTQREPPVWPGPRPRWAGCVPWFSMLGQALDFEGAEDDDDDAMA
jgi:hypothetical protein